MLLSACRNFLSLQCSTSSLLFLTALLALQRPPAVHQTKVKSALKKKGGAAAAVEAAMDEEHDEEAGAAGTAQQPAPRRRRGISFAAPEEAAEGIEEDGEAAAEPEREPIEEVGGDLATRAAVLGAGDGAGRAGLTMLVAGLLGDSSVPWVEPARRGRLCRKVAVAACCMCGMPCCSLLLPAAGPCTLSLTSRLPLHLSLSLQPEEDEEEGAAASHGASEQPSGRRRALPRGSSQRRGGRGQLALAAVEQEEAEQEEEQGQHWEEAYEEQQEEDEEEEEEVPVLPTEEQLPTGRRGGRAPRQRRLQPMFAAAEDEEEEQEGQEEVRGAGA